MRSEKDKMLGGELYDPLDPQLSAERFHRLPIRDQRHGPKSTVARLISGMVGCFVGAWSIMAMSPSGSTVSSIVQP